MELTTYYLSLTEFQNFDHSSWQIRYIHHISLSYVELLLYEDPRLSSIDLSELSNKLLKYSTLYLVIFLIVVGRQLNKC